MFIKIPSNKQLTLLIIILGEMDVLSLPNLVQLLINLKMKFNVAKLVSMFLSPSLFLCFPSLVVRSLLLEMRTFMEKLELDSSLNGRPLLLDGNKRMNLQNYQHPSQHTNDLHYVKLLINHKLF